MTLKTQEYEMQEYKMQSGYEKATATTGHAKLAGEHGQTLVEYSLILLLVVLLVVAPVSQIGGTVTQFLTSVAAGF